MKYVAPQVCPISSYTLSITNIDCSFKLLSVSLPFAIMLRLTAMYSTYAANNWRVMRPSARDAADWIRGKR